MPSKGNAVNVASVVCAVFLVLLMLSATVSATIPRFFSRVFLPPTEYPDPLLRSGFADIRQLDPAAGSGILLDKGWDLSWARFLASEPSSAAATPTVKSVSSLQHWTEYADWEGQSFPANGWASYSLRLRLGNELSGEQLTLHFQSAGAAIRIWWDGRLIETRGRLARNAEQFMGNWSSALVSLPRLETPSPAQAAAGYSEHELIFEVSAFMNQFGGIPEGIRLMTQSAAEEARLFSLLGNYFITGFFFVMALYHLVAFSYRTKNKSTLLFGFICLCFTVRVLFQETFPILELVPNLDPLLLMKINHATFAALLPAFLLLYTDLYPFRGAGVLASICIVAVGGWVIILIIGDGNALSTALRFYQAFALLLSLIMIGRLSLAMLRREIGSLLLGFGLLILVAAVAVDIADANRLLSIPALVPLSMVIFLVLQALALARRYAHALNTEEHSTMELRQLSSSLSRFVPRAFLDIIEKPDVQSVKLGDSKSQAMTVLAVNIRDFWTISEQLPDDKKFAFLNEWAASLLPAIRSQGGYVETYLGDGALCIFPGNTPGDAMSAVRAAIQVQQAADKFNAQQHAYPELNIGIGIQSGPLVLGTIGEAKGMATSVVGPAVSVAAKIEDLCQSFGARILVSGDVWRQMNNSGAFMCRYLGSYRFRGKPEPIQIYEVFDADAQTLLEQKRKNLREFEHAVNTFERGQHSAAKKEFEELQAAQAIADPAIGYYLGRLGRASS